MKKKLFTKYFTVKKVGNHLKTEVCITAGHSYYENSRKYDLFVILKQQIKFK